jgi:parvulin-like peptidyl-prolyl isomerase
MAEKLDFSIPQKKAGKPVWGVLTVLLLVILVALAAANLILLSSGRTSTPAGAARDLSTQQVKDLAAKLAQRNLYQQAVATWRDYLATADLAGPERARIYFQMGTLLEKAGLYGDAIEQYYRSEAAADVGNLRSDLNAHVKDCFEKLGEFSALRYEVMDRTSLNPSQPAGGKVVAEIGADKVTEAQLDARIEESIENQLAPMKPFMTSEQLGEQKKKALEQFRNPQTKQEFLQSWLAEEILYRQALQEDLSQKPEVKRLVHELTRGALSQQLMNDQLASKINITDTDLQTFYAANKDKYVEPTRAKISHILVAEEARANELLKRVKDGGDFAAVAKESSEDKSTKDNGGRIAEDVLKGARVPGIGDANEINAAVFAAAAPAVLDKTFKTDKGWEIIRVDEKQPERQMAFDEVRQQVTRELLRRKSEEVQREYIKEMMDKHKVIIHTSALAPPQQGTAEKTPPKQ